MTVAANLLQCLSELAQIDRTFNVRQISVLLLVAENPGCSVEDLAGWLGIKNSSAVTRITDYLGHGIERYNITALELIRRQSNQPPYTYELTDKGREMIEKFEGYFEAGNES